MKMSYECENATMEREMTIEYPAAIGIPVSHKSI